MNARQRLQADLDRYFAHYEKPLSRWGKLQAILNTEGIWANLVLRWGQYLQQEAPFLVRLVFELPWRLAWRGIGHTVGIHLYPGSSIGPGLYIGHYGGIWISPRATIGANCSLSQGVTIGAAGRNRSRGPILGERVWVGPNAVITGAITIGDGAVIGANSLVVTNIPENAMVMGVPARVLSTWGSGNLIVMPKPSADAKA